MLKRLLAPAVLLALACWFGGCAADNEPEPEPAAQPTVQIAVVPDRVIQAFRDDFPSAGITDVEHQRTATGLPLYRFVFIQDGNPGNATYYADGLLLDKSV